VSVGAEHVLMAEGILSLPEEPADDPLGALVHRIRSGEVAAFEELMALTERRVLSTAWRILGDRHLAEDAAQETYLRVFRSLHRFRLGEPFEAWLIRIAVHVCYDLGRKRGPLPVPMETLDSLESDAAPLDAEETVLLQQRRALVRQALASLPQAERTALVLRDLEGLGTEEAARVLGVRPVTIRSQVASARAKVQAICARLIKPLPGGRP
jgi:RNA polymerase sigma-70 factor (ECF subfamily)